MATINPLKVAPGKNPLSNYYGGQLSVPTNPFQSITPQNTQTSTPVSTQSVGVQAKTPVVKQNTNTIPSSQAKIPTPVATPTTRIASALYGALKSH